MKRLLIGAGADKRPGWVSLDANPAHAPDHVAVVPPLPAAVRDTSWDVIEADHFIGLVFRWAVVELIQEFYQALASTGMLVLEQPNIEYCARVLLGLETPPAATADQFSYWGFYGDPTHRDPFHSYRWGYTPQTLSDVLVEGGFQRDRIAVLPALHHQPRRDFRIEARK